MNSGCSGIAFLLTHRFLHNKGIRLANIKHAIGAVLPPLRE
jgi:hypothetical protein